MYNIKSHKDLGIIFDNTGNLSFTTTPLWLQPKQNKEILEPYMLVTLFVTIGSLQWNIVTHMGAFIYFGPEETWKVLQKATHLLPTIINKPFFERLVFIIFRISRLRGDLILLYKTLNGCLSSDFNNLFTYSAYQTMLLAPTLQPF